MSKSIQFAGNIVDRHETINNLTIIHILIPSHPNYIVGKCWCVTHKYNICARFERYKEAVRYCLTTLDLVGGKGPFKIVMSIKNVFPIFPNIVTYAQDMTTAKRLSRFFVNQAIDGDTLAISKSVITEVKSRKIRYTIEREAFRRARSTLFPVKAKVK